MKFRLVCSIIASLLAPLSSWAVDDQAAVIARIDERTKAIDAKLDLFREEAAKDRALLRKAIEANTRQIGDLSGRMDSMFYWVMGALVAILASGILSNSRLSKKLNNFVASPPPTEPDEVQKLVSKIDDYMKSQESLEEHLHRLGGDPEKSGG